MWVSNAELSAFNAQGSRVPIVVVQVGAVKIYVGEVEVLRKKERRDETQFTTKIGEKLVWDPVISFYKILSFSVKCLMPYYPETGILAPWSPDFTDNSIMGRILL